MSAIGSGSQPDSVVYRHRLQQGDRLLLCTDGVNLHVDDNEIGQLMASDSSARDISEKVIALANERGGNDNITVVVARIDEAG